VLLSILKISGCFCSLGERFNRTIDNKSLQIGTKQFCGEAARKCGELTAK
jgi:hypothetical protein